MLDWAKICEGITIGIGGGVGVSICFWIKDYIFKLIHKRRVYNWLKKSINPINPKYKFRTTQTIASYTNLTKNRVRYICEIHPKIREIRGEDSEDKWTIYSKE